MDEDERLLLGILRVLIKNSGKLRSEPNANPNDPQSPEVQLVSLLNESDQRRRRLVHKVHKKMEMAYLYTFRNQSASFPPPKPVQYATVDRRCMSFLGRCTNCFVS